MSKTLAIILNHNLPEATDDLFESLFPFQEDLYELLVIDNGSHEKHIAKNTFIRLNENIFWGGALNVAFNMVLEDEKYDSLLFLNNDIELNGDGFVSTLRTAMFKNDLAIVTPCMAGKANPWKQMMNWGTQGIRIVNWIDNQAPLFSRKLIEEIGQFDEALKYGWGQELVCYDICKKYDWGIGICDYLSVLHYGHLTFVKDRFMVDQKLNIEDEIQKKDFESFSKAAHRGFTQRFSHDLEKYIRMHDYGKLYGPSDIVLYRSPLFSIRGMRNRLCKLF